MFFYYKNSFLASMVSIIGCGLVMTAIAMFGDGEIAGGIGMILLAVPFLIGGKVISDNKSFKKWWKQVKDANLEPSIANSVETAFAVFKKNPCKRTLNKIRSLNPQAAVYIQQNYKF